jgi:hypothetical protein
VIRLTSSRAPAFVAAICERDARPRHASRAPSGRGHRSATTQWPSQRPTPRLGRRAAQPGVAPQARRARLARTRVPARRWRRRTPRLRPVGPSPLLHGTRRCRSARTVARREPAFGNSCRGRLPGHRVRPLPVVRRSRSPAHNRHRGCGRRQSRQAQRGQGDGGGSRRGPDRQLRAASQRPR